MKTTLPTFLRRLLAGTALLAALAPARADLLTFDALDPALYDGGATLFDGAYRLTALADPYTTAHGIASLAGAVLDPADPGSCAGIACPLGDGTRYYAGLNDGGVRLERADGRTFAFAGLDFGFVALQRPGATSGQLLLTGAYAGGSATVALDFPSLDAGGGLVFAPAALAGFAGLHLTSVEIRACVFIDGACVNSLEQSAFNEAQFAIDNLDVSVSAVPEPATWLALLAGLGIVALRRRTH